MQAIEFIKLTPENIQELKTLSWDTFYRSFSEVNTPENLRTYMDVAFSEQTLLAELKNPDSQFYFAKRQGQTVGYMKVNTNSAQNEPRGSTTMELERIYVIQEYQGQKIGQKLLDKTIALAKEFGKDMIWLGVWDKNVHAVRFYQRNGFQMDGSHSFQMGDEIQTDYIMMLRLT